jgi:hypothetical protein
MSPADKYCRRKDRIDSTDEPMTTQWADLLEASLRPDFLVYDPFADDAATG